MAHIFPCGNTRCWQRLQCLRYMEVRPNYDVTCVEIPIPEDGEPCNCFVAILPGDRLRDAK